MGLLRRRLMIKEALKRESDKVAKLPLNDSLVDAWVFSGYENADAPTSIVGVNGNKLACHNFAWNETGSGFMDGALWFDGVVDYLSNENMPLLTDYTIIAKRTFNDCPVNSMFAYKCTSNGSAAAFEFERNNSGLQLSGPNTTASFGGGGFISNNIPELVTYQTKTSYNGLIELTPNTISDGSHLYISARTGGSWGQINITLYYFALYDRTLTEQEIKEEIIKLEYRWNLRKKMAV